MLLLSFLFLFLFVFFLLNKTIFTVHLLIVHLNFLSLFSRGKTFFACDCERRPYLSLESNLSVIRHWITRVHKTNRNMGLPKAEFLSPTPDQIERLRSDFFDRLNRDGAPCEGTIFI